MKLKKQPALGIFQLWRLFWDMWNHWCRLFAGIPGIKLGLANLGVRFNFEEIFI